MSVLKLLCSEKQKKSEFFLHRTLSSSHVLTLESWVSNLLWLKGLVLVSMSLTSQSLQSYLSNHSIRLVTF